MADRFTADYSAQLSKVLDEPAWLAERRAHAYERFASLPWPDQSAEEWRHTDIRGLDLERFDPEEASPWSVDLERDAGVRWGPLQSVATDDEDAVRRWLGRAGVSEFEQKLHALNAAFGIGLFFSVRPGAVVERPIVVSHTIARGAAALPRTVLVAGEGSSVTFIHRYSGGDGGGIAVPVVEIYAEPGANVTYLAIQDWDREVWHFGINRAQVMREATVRTLTTTLGGKLSRSVVESVLDGEGAHAEMLGAYFGDHDQHIDNRTLQLHRARNTSSLLRYKGALKGTSRAVYLGRVDIEKDAVQSDAQQENRNLLLSPGASALPEPFLEIKTSEVTRATHGVSVGRPDAQVLFYLQSRGLDPADAERVYVTGFFQEIIDRVRVPEIREELEAAVEAELALES